MLAGAPNTELVVLVAGAPNGDAVVAPNALVVAPKPAGLGAPNALVPDVPPNALVPLVEPNPPALGCAAPKGVLGWPNAEVAAPNPPEAGVELPKPPVAC